MNRLRILKLGWEFPPLINGGLDIAAATWDVAAAKVLKFHEELAEPFP